MDKQDLLNSMADDVKKLNDLLSKQVRYNFNHNDLKWQRIIFGAPGTGKSYKLEKESKVFINQAPITLDIDHKIKTELIEASKRKGKLAMFLAIGYKYSAQISKKNKSQIVSDYGIDDENIYGSS